jgi:hypothetical protein
MNIHSASTFKYAKFGRGSVSLEARNGQALSLDTIAQQCPSAFAPHKHSSRSDRYTYVPTMEIMTAMAKEGFLPHSIMQGGSKDEEKRGFTKHLIRFRHPSVVGRGGQVYETVLLGSHDGTTSTQLYGGFFRFACKNGSIFFDGQATQIKVPHVGNIVDKVIEGAYTVVEQGKLAYDHVDNFSQIGLNRDEQRALASAALALRYDDPEVKAPIEPDRLLNVRRSDDRASDLWTTFNVLQENVLRGGIGYQARREINGQPRLINATTREVRSVDGNVHLNRALWVLAEEMAKIKAAA